MRPLVGSYDHRIPALLGFDPPHGVDTTAEDADGVGGGGVVGAGVGAGASDGDLVESVGGTVALVKDGCSVTTFTIGGDGEGDCSVNTFTIGGGEGDGEGDGDRKESRVPNSEEPSESTAASARRDRRCWFDFRHVLSKFKLIM